MVQHANILSFDEMKSKASVSRPSVASKKSAKRSTSQQQQTSKAKKRPKVKSVSKSSAKTVGKSAPKSNTKTSVKSSAKTSAKSPAKTNAKSTAKSPAKTTGKSNAKSSVKKNASPKSAPNRPSESTARPAFNKQSGSAKVSKFSEIKRNHTKNKAGKTFTKQVESAPSRPTSEGPRAALYKAEMGSSQKKATKMQNSSPANSAKKTKGSPKGIGKLFHSVKAAATLAVIVGLVFSCVFLYPTAQQYYVAVRQHDQLNAEYEALQVRNSLIESEVNALSTDEGIEDKARSEFGWVKKGENSVKVYGLESDLMDSNYKKAIPAGSVPAPETWYSPVLDFIFNFDQ